MRAWLYHVKVYMCLDTLSKQSLQAANHWQNGIRGGEKGESSEAQQGIGVVGDTHKHPIKLLFILVALHAAQEGLGGLINYMLVPFYTHTHKRTKHTHQTSTDGVYNPSYPLPPLCGCDCAKTYKLTHTFASSSGMFSSDWSM